MRSVKTGGKTMRDYLNLTDTAFDNWFTRFNQYLAQKCSGSSPEWTHIPSTERNNLGVIWTN
jgi:hypothetical protein